jgi:hypothetical protein
VKASERQAEQNAKGENDALVTLAQEAQAPKPHSGVTNEIKAQNSRANPMSDDQSTFIQHMVEALADHRDGEPMPPEGGAYTPSMDEVIENTFEGEWVFDRTEELISESVIKRSQPPEWYVAPSITDVISDKMRGAIESYDGLCAAQTLPIAALVATRCRPLGFLAGLAATAAAAAAAEYRRRNQVSFRVAAHRTRKVTIQARARTLVEYRDLRPQTLRHTQMTVRAAQVWVTVDDVYYTKDHKTIIKHKAFPLNWTMYQELSRTSVLSQKSQAAFDQALTLITRNTSHVGRLGTESIVDDETENVKFVLTEAWRNIRLV